MDSLVHGLRGLLLIDDLSNDIRFAFRSLKKHALLSTTVVVTLAFGLGLNTGVFTLINAALFRAHVDKDPETFFRLRAYYSDGFAQASLGCRITRLCLQGRDQCGSWRHGTMCGQPWEREPP